MGDAVQVLITSYGSNHVQVTGTRKVLDLFENKKVAYVQVDGSSDVDTRNQLWEKSGKRSYPQVFIKGEYVGDHEYLQELLDIEAFDEKFKEYMVQQE